MSNLVYHSSHKEGGLAMYSAHQFPAIMEITGKHRASFHGPDIVENKESVPVGRAGKLLRYWRNTVGPFHALDKLIQMKKPRWVLINTWSEYFSPFWAPALRKHRKHGVHFGAVIHDPIRDYRVGPSWWHTRSIQEAYSFLDIAFIHDDTPLDLGGSTRAIKLVEIPHGPYPVSVPKEQCSITVLREDMGIPKEAFVLLCFGHIRDGKNLDLLLKAAVGFPDVHILVAGRAQSSGQKHVAHYHNLATDLGMKERCHWFNDYIPNDEVWKYFVAADAIALTYSANFRSASGVLNVNAQFRKPVLASCGQSPLKTAIQKYDLGPWVKPDSSAEIERGLKCLLKNPKCPEAKWDDYLKDNSWEENARRVINAFESLTEY